MKTRNNAEIIVTRARVRHRGGAFIHGLVASYSELAGFGGAKDEYTAAPATMALATTTGRA